MEFYMKKIDLHVHSTFSDGTDTPKQLVKLAYESGLCAMALTDHDTTKGINEAIAAVKEYNYSSFEIVPGVELSTQYTCEDFSREIHIVGLYIDHNNKNFNDELERQRQLRINKNKLMCDKFLELGMDVTFDEMSETYKGSVITRAHFADIIVKKGYVKNRKEAFDKYLSEGRPCFVARQKIDSKDAVKMIHDAGGTAILAHPMLYNMTAGQLNILIDYLKLERLDGIEALYSTYTPNDELIVKDIAKNKGLIISGGSDYHGKNKPDIKLGTGMGHLSIPVQVLDDIKKYRSSDAKHTI